MAYERVRPRGSAPPAGPPSGTTGSVTGPRLGRGRVGFDSPVPDAWACSAAGSASPRQGEGQRFDSAQVHHAFRAPMEERAVEAREVVGSTPAEGTSARRW